MKSKSENKIVIVKGVDTLTGRLKVLGVWRSTEHSLKVTKALTRKLLPTRRALMLEKLKELGANSVTGLIPSKRREFYEFLQTLKS